MISNLSLGLTGEQAHRLADDKRRELAAHWGHPRRTSAERASRPADRSRSRLWSWARRRPAAC